LTRGTYGRGSYIGLWDATPILAADFSVKPLYTACCWSIWRHSAHFRNWQIN